MNENFDLFAEKYTSILCGIVGLVISIFTIQYNNAVVLAWLDNTRWFLFALGCLSLCYFFMLKIFIRKNALVPYSDTYCSLTYCSGCSVCSMDQALQLLENHPQEKKRFYRHFDKITYSSLLVATITFFYPNLCNIFLYHKIYICIAMGLMSYMFSQIIILYMILHKFKQYSRQARK